MITPEHIWREDNTDISEDVNVDPLWWQCNNLYNLLEYLTDIVHTYISVVFIPVGDHHYPMACNFLASQWEYLKCMDTENIFNDLNYGGKFETINSLISINFNPPLP